MTGWVKVDEETGAPYMLIGNYADRQETLRGMYAEERGKHIDAKNALECMLEKIQHLYIAECAATSMGKDDPDAQQVGDALATAILAGSRVNLHIFQLLGQCADLYDKLLSGIGLPDSFRDAPAPRGGAADGRG